MQYSPHNRCTTCTYLLNPLSRNKGTRTLSNRNRLQQTVCINLLYAETNRTLTIHAQCSNKLCRETHFYSDQLDKDVAEGIIATLEISPLLHVELLHPSQSSNMDLHHIMNSSPVRPQQAIIASMQQPMLPSQSRTEIQSSLDCGNGKIRCGNSACATKAKEPRKGHKQCVGFFCRTCCLETVRLAMECSQPVTRCGVPTHVAGAGAYIAVSQHVPMSTPTGPMQQPAGELFPQRQPDFATDTPNSVPVRPEQQPIVGPMTHHANPIADPWRRASPAWLDKHLEAAGRDTESTENKKSAAETKALQRIGITVIVWYKVSSSFVITYH